MKARSFRTAFALIAAGSLVACEVSNPNKPTMSFGAPQASQPSNGVNFNYVQQPVTLTIANAPRTSATSSAVTYSVEVATNNGFSNPVFTRADIAESPGGTTSVTLPTLNGDTQYYWRWRATVDQVIGQPSATQAFLMRAQVIIQAPTLATPANGASIFAARPTFTTNNAPTTGPASTKFYDFQVSTSAAFGNIVAQVIGLQEQSGSTSWTPTTDLPEGQLFWRVRASDPANAVTGPFSNATQFERRAGIDLEKVAYYRGHPNISTWRETARITSASHSGSTLCIEHTANWPSVNFFGDPAAGLVEGNQWMFVLIDNVWHGGAGHWYRPGQSCKGEVDEHFFTDAFIHPPFNSLVVRPGTTFGVAVSTPARAWPDMATRDERTNVVLIVW